MRDLLLLLTFVVCNNVVLAKTFGGLSYLYCNLQYNGQNYCWGKGSDGQLGHGAFADSPFPVKMLNVYNATDLAVGDLHTVIVDQGKARCTGHQVYVGRISSVEHTNTLVDVEGVSPSETVKQVFAGPEHSCLITATGGAKCWGANLFGQLGNSAAVSHTRAFPIIDFETSGVAAIAVGNFHTCLLNIAGKVYCAGRNEAGQLGRGSSSSGINALMQPVIGQAIAETMVSISSGHAHTCALGNTGGLYCWGYGEYGQLGQGNNETLYVF